MAHIKFSPEHKKHIDMVYEMYRNNKNGSLSTLDIRETWRFGAGFTECDDESIKTWARQDVYYVDNRSGENEASEFDDLIDVQFHFSDDVLQKERDKFIDAYHSGDKQGRRGGSFIYEGAHKWEIETDSVEVYAPARVDLCDESGIVIRKLKLV